MPASIHSNASSLSLSFNSDSAPSSPELYGEDFSLRPSRNQTLEFGTDDGRTYVMVIGGLGYIGSHTTLELLKDGYNVIVVDNLSNSYESALANIKRLASDHCRSMGMILPELHFHKLDYRSSSMRALFPKYAAARSYISGVILFAAFKSVEESISRPLAYYQNNICGLVELLVTLQEQGVKNIVFSSSATVYGTRANEGKPLQETDLVHHEEAIKDAHGNKTHLLPEVKGLTSPYGRTKYFAEAILADVAKADPTMRITALRYFNPVGCHASGLLREDPRQKPTNLFPVIVNVMTGSKSVLDIFGSNWETRDGTAIRDFIHVVDLAQGHVAALATTNKDVRRPAFRAYNLGTGKGMTVAEIVSSFELVSGQTIPVCLAPKREGDVGFCVAATQRAERELGWTTQMSVDECTRDTWNAITLLPSNRK